MTKKILALALAGTTAFSVFGGLNVFAATGEADYSSYKPVEIKIVNSNLAFDSVELTAGSTPEALKKTVAKLVIDENAENVGDLEIKNGLVYLFDYKTNGDIVGKGDDEDLDALVKVLRAVSNLDDASYPADGAYSATNIVKTITDAMTEYIETSGDDFVKQTGETVTGSTLRKNVVDDFTALLDEVISPDDVEKTGTPPTVPYKYDLLHKAIKTDIGKSGIYSAQTSHMMYLRQEYDRLSGVLNIADASTSEEKIARYTEILDARSSEDYKNASSYTTFLGRYEKIVEDYDGKTSPSKLSSYAKDLQALLTDNTGTSAGVDKDDLKSILDTAKEYLDDKSSYDDDEDAWNYFEEINREATAVYNRGKSYSYQSTVDAYTTLLTEAIKTLDPNSSVSDWVVLRLEMAVEAAKDLVETDYTTSSWKKLTSTLEKAEKLLDSTTASKSMLTTAADNLEKAMDAMSVKTPSATLKKQLRTAIEDAEKMLDGLTNATGAQAVALSKAINNGKDLFDKGNVKNNFKAKTLISAVEGAIADIEAAMTTAAQPQGWYKNDAGKWMYGEGDSYYTNGWKKVGASWYYFNADGTAKQNEWFKDTDGEWYWFTNNANAAYGWAKVNGEWYYFKGGCKMVTGWYKVNGGWYYMAPSGKMMTGWVKVNNKWYYLSKESNAYGKMLENTTTPDGYKVGADGAMIG